MRHGGGKNIMTSQKADATTKAGVTKAEQRIDRILTFYNTTMEKTIDTLITDTTLPKDFMKLLTRWKAFHIWLQRAKTSLSAYYEFFKRIMLNINIVGSHCSTDCEAFIMLFYKYIHFFTEEETFPYDFYVNMIIPWWTTQILDRHILDELLQKGPRHDLIIRMFHENLPDMLKILDDVKVLFLREIQPGEFLKLVTKITPIVERAERTIVLQDPSIQRAIEKKVTRHLRWKYDRQQKQALAALLRQRSQVDDIPFEQLLARFGLTPETRPSRRPSSRSIALPAQQGGQASPEGEADEALRRQVQARKQQLARLQKALRGADGAQQQQQHGQRHWEWRHKARQDNDPTLQRQLLARKRFNGERMARQVQEIGEMLFEKYKDYDAVVIVDVQNIWRYHRKDVDFQTIQAQLISTGRDRVKQEFYGRNPDINPERCGWIFVTQTNLSRTGEAHIQMDDVGDTIIRVACALPDAPSRDCYTHDIPSNPMDDMVILNLYEKFRAKRRKSLESFNRRKARLAQAFQDKLSQLQRIIVDQDQFDYVDLANHRLFKNKALKTFTRQYQSADRRLPPEPLILSLDRFKDWERVLILN